MLKIRLTRVGKTNSPLYRVVVADQKRAVNGKFIEILGNYNPTSNPKKIVINEERALFWIGQGAQTSDTVKNLMCDLGILAKDQKVDKKYSKKFTKKQIKEGVTEESVKAEEAKTEESTTEAVEEKTTEEPEVEQSTATEESAE